MLNMLQPLPFGELTAACELVQKTDFWHFCIWSLEYKIICSPQQLFLWGFGRVIEHVTHTPPVCRVWCLKPVKCAARETVQKKPTSSRSALFLSLRHQDYFPWINVVSLIWVWDAETCHTYNLAPSTVEELKSSTLQRLGRNACAVHSLISMALRMWNNKWITVGTAEVRITMLMDRQRGKRNGGVLVLYAGEEKEVGVGGGVIPHLQCSAGLHHPIISQLSVKGAGPEADDSQGEFSVRQSECEREKKVSESQREKQLCLVLQDSVYRRGSTFLCLFSFFPLCSFAVPLFATASSAIFASHSSLLIAVSSWSSTLTFHSPPFSFSSFQSSVCLFSLLVDGVRGFF